MSVYIELADTRLGDRIIIRTWSDTPGRDISRGRPEWNETITVVDLSSLGVAHTIGFLDTRGQVWLFEDWVQIVELVSRQYDHDELVRVSNDAGLYSRLGNANLNR